MPRKSSQLQIRVSPEQKRQLKRFAREASMDMSTWALSRLLDDDAARFQELTGALATSQDRRLALANLADFLRSLQAGAFERAVSHPPRAHIDDATLNHLAGAVELASERRGVAAPAWTRDVRVPDTPAFGSSLSSVRMYLLTRAPLALRRRNIFVDASIDERV